MSHDLPTAILLDLDDTILESAAVRDRVWRSVSDSFSNKVDGLDPGTLYATIQEHRRWYWSDPDRHRIGRLDPDMALREQVDGTLLRLDVRDSSLAEDIARSFRAQLEEAVKPFPGAIDTLARLRERGIRLALVTNGSAETQRRKVRKFELDRYFDYILVEGEFGAGKPDERVYLHALNRLEAAPGESWMIGDNLLWEVDAPQRLGMFGVWVDVAGKGLPESPPAQPDRIVSTLPEVLIGSPFSAAG